MCERPKAAAAAAMNNARHARGEGKGRVEGEGDLCIPRARRAGADPAGLFGGGGNHPKTYYDASFLQLNECPVSETLWQLCREFSLWIYSSMLACLEDRYPLLRGGF